MHTPQKGRAGTDGPAKPAYGAGGGDRGAESHDDALTGESEQRARLLIGPARQQLT